MPLNAARHDEEVAFIAFARATSRQQHITNDQLFYLLSGCSSLLLLPLALDWSNKVLTVTLLGAAVCLQVYCDLV